MSMEYGSKLVGKQTHQQNQIQLRVEGTLICTPPCAAPCKGSGVPTITALKDPFIEHKLNNHYLIERRPMDEQDIH